MLISVGYAFLSTQLTINGTATVKNNSWNVHFANIVPNANNSVASVDTAPTLSNNNTTVTWEVSMDTPGQIYEFNVDVVNEGTIDAMVNTATNSIVTSTLTAAQQEYLDYSIKYVNGADIEQYDKLAAGETKTITVKLLFKQDIDADDLPSTAQNGIRLSYTADYVQADSRAVTKVTRTANGPIIVGNDTVQRWDPVNYDAGSLTTTTASIDVPDGASLSEAIDASEASGWVVLDVKENGDVLIIPTTYDSTELTLSGMDGYNNAIEALDAVAGIYVNPTYASSARSITVDDVNAIEGFDTATEAIGPNGVTYDFTNRYGMDNNFNIVDHGENNAQLNTYKMTEDTADYSYTLNNSVSYLTGLCWLASRCVGLDSNYCDFYVRSLNDGNVDHHGDLFYVGDDGDSYGNSNSCAVLPVVTLKSGIHMEKKNGTWQLSE